MESETLRSSERGILEVFVKGYLQITHPTHLPCPPPRVFFPVTSRNNPKSSPDTLSTCYGVAVERE
jgi:hypothetical protein